MPSQSEASFVCTCVCVPSTAVTRPARCRPIATFSLVASACMSTSTTGARALTSAAIAAAISNGLQAGSGWTKRRPIRLTTPTRVPSRASTTVEPRPGLLAR